MKISMIFLSSLFFTAIVHGDEKLSGENLQKHQQGAETVADEQDELSADVQQLTIEQTVPEVIKLLAEVEEIMDEVTDSLSEHDTGGKTIAGQTEVIEKIHAAAKERQKQSGAGQAGGAMMDMMERMMGQTPEGDEPGKEKGDQPGEQGGEGQEGDSDAANSATAGQGDGNKEIRRVPKASGNAGRALPEEFRQALDAYNRGVETNLKK